MGAVTVTQEEYNRELNNFYGNKEIFEEFLRTTIKDYDDERINNERSKKLRMMLDTLTFEKYDVKSIEIDGKGVDRFITYMEYKDGTPLTVEELEGLDSDMQWDLMSETY